MELAFALRNLSPYHPMMFAAWVAPACFIFRHVFCFASFLLLFCLRMSGCGMFYSRSGISGMFLLSACFGMFDFLACLSTFFFRPAAFHTQLRPGAGLACGRYDRQGPTALDQRCAAQT